MSRVIPSHILFILKHYLLGLFVFFLFRLVLFFAHNMEHEIADKSMSLITNAFLVGVKFDSVVMGYILFLPAVLLSILSFTKINLYKAVHYFILFLVFIAFFISSADIPYFNFNFSRLTAVVFEWASDAGIIFTMVTEEPSYFLYTIVLLVLFALYVFLSRNFTKNKNTNTVHTSNRWSYIGLSLVGLFFAILSIRGGIDGPIRINHSFFCNNSFYNQLGLNPSFSLLKSLKQQKALAIIDDKVATANMLNYLGVKKLSTEECLIARETRSEKSPLKKNIVLVLMESMSANKMSRFGNKNNLTPFLDSLANQSYSFDNIYSAGIHTCNGIFSTLYSYPTVLRERPMSALDLKHFHSMPTVLKDKGYTNVYFTTHSETFDNVGGFLPKNHIDKIISQKDYDPGKVQNAFGVPDHVLFEYAIDELGELSKKDNPFFATIMTVSDHGPYIIPDNIAFTPHTGVIKKQIVEYSDWSLKQFMNDAKTKGWYKNTVFVFVADHGVVMDDFTYELPLSQHHIPFIIHTADTTVLKPQTNYNYGGQIDVLPTVLGFLNFSYTNNTFGVDLLKKKRPYAYFSSDNKLACIDDDFFYIYKTNGNEYLYDYKNRSTENEIETKKGVADKMKSYVISLIQLVKKVVSSNKFD